MFLAWSPIRSSDLATNIRSSAARDRARVLDHVGQQLAQDAPGSARRPRRRAARRPARTSASSRASPSSARRSMSITSAATRWICGRPGLDALGEPQASRATQRDLLRLVADALEIGDRLVDHHQEPQVVRRRRAPRDHLACTPRRSSRSSWLTRASSRDHAGDERTDRRSAAPRSRSGSGTRRCRPSRAPACACLELGVEVLRGMRGGLHGDFAADAG